jgi:hypothetical protein
MKKILRITIGMALLFLAGACVHVGQIQQTEPVRVAKFTGSHKSVAQCVQRRLGGKVMDDTLNEKYVIYDSVKAKSNSGLTHYSITVARSGPDQVIAEWRVVKPGPTLSPWLAPSLQTLTPDYELKDAAVQEFWVPVQDCAQIAGQVKAG